MDGVVATAAHVVEHEGYSPITVFCNGREVEATVIISQPERDVALLAADCTGPALQFHLGKLEVDHKLLISGYNFETGTTGGSRVTTAIQFHIVSSPIPSAILTADKIPDDSDMGAKALVQKMEEADSPLLLAVTGTIERGNSGSPVFTKDGAIVGMAVIFDGTHNRTFMVPAESIFLAMIAADVF
ncbi:serine protease [Patescibacteria group bacterium]